MSHEETTYTVELSLNGIQGSMPLVDINIYDNNYEYLLLPNSRAYAFKSKELAIDMAKEAITGQLFANVEGRCGEIKIWGSDETPELTLNVNANYNEDDDEYNLVIDGQDYPPKVQWIIHTSRHSQQYFPLPSEVSSSNVVESAFRKAREYYNQDTNSGIYIEKMLNDELVATFRPVETTVTLIDTVAYQEPESQEIGSWPVDDYPYYEFLTFCKEHELDEKDDLKVSRTYIFRDQFGYFMRAQHIGTMFPDGKDIYTIEEAEEFFKKDIFKFI